MRTQPQALSTQYTNKNVSAIEISNVTLQNPSSDWSLLHIKGQDKAGSRQ